MVEDGGLVELFEDGVEDLAYFESRLFVHVFDGVDQQFAEDVAR